MKKIVFCKACGKIIDRYGNQKEELCSKHAAQFRKYGEIKDHNQRTVWDDNEIRTFSDYAEIDTYDQFGNVIETYTLDLEDVKYLNGKKWRTVYKGKKKSPYLVTGHTIYFHILINGFPNLEIDHISRDTHDNRKDNLRLVSRQEQVYNTLKTNISGIKGVYYKKGKPLGWHAECQCNGKRYFSPCCATKEEAAYYRFLFESILLKNYMIANTKEIFDCIAKLSEEQKLNIQKYFRNKAKA